MEGIQTEPPAQPEAPKRRSRDVRALVERAKKRRKGTWNIPMGFDEDTGEELVLEVEYEDPNDPGLLAAFIMADESAEDKERLFLSLLKSVVKDPVEIYEPEIWAELPSVAKSPLYWNTLHLLGFSAGFLEVLGRIAGVGTAQDRPMTSQPKSPTGSDSILETSESGAPPSSSTGEVSQNEDASESALSSSETSPTSSPPSSPRNESNTPTSGNGPSGVGPRRSPLRISAPATSTPPRSAGEE